MMKGLAGVSAFQVVEVLVSPFVISIPVGVAMPSMVPECKGKVGTICACVEIGHIYVSRCSLQTVFIGRGSNVFH